MWEGVYISSQAITGKSTERGGYEAKISRDGFAESIIVSKFASDLDTFTGRFVCGQILFRESFDHIVVVWPFPLPNNGVTHGVVPVEFQKLLIGKTLLHYFVISHGVRDRFSVIDECDVNGRIIPIEADVSGDDGRIGAFYELPRKLQGFLRHPIAIDHLLKLSGVYESHADSNYENSDFGNELPSRESFPRWRWIEMVMGRAGLGWG